MGPSSMMSRAEANCRGRPASPPSSQGWGRVGMRRLDTAKPVRPALGFAPAPVAASSRNSPPAPVAAPGKGERAVGWLWVSTFSTMRVSSEA